MLSPKTPNKSLTNINQFTVDGYNSTVSTKFTPVCKELKHIGYGSMDTVVKEEMHKINTVVPLLVAIFNRGHSNVATNFCCCYCECI